MTVVMAHSQDPKKHQIKTLKIRDSCIHVSIHDGFFFFVSIAFISRPQESNYISLAGAEVI